MKLNSLFYNATPYPLKQFSLCQIRNSEAGLSVIFFEMLIMSVHPRQRRNLLHLYCSPNASATAKHLANKINPLKPSPIIASGTIGKMGKRIAEFYGIVVSTYPNKRKNLPAYFTLISEVYDKKIGWTINQTLQKALAELQLAADNRYEILELLPTEVNAMEAAEDLKEGNVVQVFVNRYERNLKAGILCIEHYGWNCMACGFNLEEAYGIIGKGVYSVHHVNRISEKGEEYRVDPVADLIPLCANCHCMVHSEIPMLSLKQLKTRIQKK